MMWSKGERKRVAIVSQVFPPDDAPAALAMRELAEFLQERGWEVTVCAGFPCHPRGIGDRSMPRQLWSAQTLPSGVRVTRGWHTVPGPSQRLAFRALSYITQGIAMGLLAGASKPQIMIVLGPPLIGPLVGAVISRLVGAKLVSLIYDLFPGAAIGSGRLRNSWAIRAAFVAERLQYRSANLTMTISDGFRRHVLASAALDPAKALTVPIWLADFPLALEKSRTWRQSIGVSDAEFLVLHAGTLGIAHDPDVILGAVEILRSHPVRFVVVGGGEGHRRLSRFVLKRGPPNLTVLPFVDRATVPIVLGAADACLVTLSRGAGSTSVPSKVIAYFAAQKPVIAVADASSDTFQEIRDHHIGPVVEAGDSSTLAAEILRLARDEELRTECGRRARARYDSHYRPDLVLPVIERALREL